jgi:proline iminopeptidase
MAKIEKPPRQQAAQTHHLDIREGIVDTPGSQLFYRTAGNGKPLVILHGGIGLSQGYLLPYMLQLANSSFVILYDQRACGDSTGEINLTTMTIENFVKDLDAIRKAFHYEKISILGHSWGGFVAMNYAIAHPNHVEKLIVSNSMPVSSDDMALFAKEWNQRIAPYQAKLDSIKVSKEFEMGDPDVVERYFQMFFRPCFFRPENVALLNVRMTPIAAIHSVQVYECFQKTLFAKHFDLHPLLKKLQLPTLVIHGDSEQIPAITAENIHESIPHSKYELLKHCGHFPYIEAPEEYFELITTFLHEPHPSTDEHPVDLSSFPK